MEKSNDLMMLKSPNHHLMLTRGLWNMYQSNQGVDFEIGWNTWAHRCVLDVFLSTARLIPGDTEHLLNEENLNCMLEFLYTGQVIVRRDQLTVMLETAKEINFRLLVDAVTVVGQKTSAQPNIIPSGCGLKLPSELTRHDHMQELSILPDAVESVSSVVPIKLESLDSLAFSKTANEPQTIMEKRTDLITLSGTSHHLMLTGGLWDMYQSNQGVNFDIGWGVWAHRCILDVFLSTARLVPSDTEHLLDEKTLNLLLEFLYTGQVTVSKDQLTIILETAKESGFQLLVDAITAANHNTSIIQLNMDVHFPTSKMPQLNQRLDRMPVNGDSKLPSELIKTHEHSILPDLVEPESTVRQIKQEPHDWLEHKILPDVQMDVERCLQSQLSKSKSAKKQSEKDSEEADSLSMSNKSKSVSSKKRSYTRRISSDGTKLQHICEECGKVFPRHYSLMRHSLTHSGDRPFSCNICGKMFQTMASMTDHQLTHNKPTDSATLDKIYPHKCGECGKAFRKPYTLMLHSRVHTGEHPFTCDVCGKAFKYKHNRNECNHNNIKLHVCSECGHSFAKAKDLKAHQGIHTGKKVFGCETCGKVFSSNYSLMRHSLTHTGERPYSCPICGKMFQTAYSVNDHLLTHNKPTDAADSQDKINPHKCRECGKTFQKPHALMLHSRVHTRVRQFTCDVCGKAFKYEQARDVCNHNNVKTHGCSECGHSFAKIKDLEAHHGIHAGEKLFECETCGKVFTTITRRARHLITHSCEKSFVCGVCGKSFSLAEDLHCHSSTHSNLNPLECETCGKSFRTISCRNRHLQTHINSATLAPQPGLV